MDDVFAAETERHFYAGESGAATKVKLLANVMVCVHKLIGAEVLNPAEKSGMEKEVVFKSKRCQFECLCQEGTAYDHSKASSKVELGHSVICSNTWLVPLPSRNKLERIHR